MSKTFEETLASIDSTLVLILAALQAGSPAATGTATVAATVAGADSTKPTGDGKPDTPAVRGKTAYYRLPNNGGVISFGANTSNEPEAGSTKITKAEYDKALADEAEAKKAQSAAAAQKPDTSVASSTATDSPSGSPSTLTAADVQVALTKLGQTPETGRAALLSLFEKWGIKRFPELAAKVPPIPNEQLMADIVAAGQPAAESEQEDPFGGLGL